MLQITANPPPNKPAQDEQLTILDKRYLLELILCLTYFMEEEEPGAFQLLAVAAHIPNLSEPAIENKFSEIFNRQK